MQLFSTIHQGKQVILQQRKLAISPTKRDLRNTGRLSEHWQHIYIGVATAGGRRMHSFVVQYDHEAVTTPLFQKTENGPRHKAHT